MQYLFFSKAIVLNLLRYFTMVKSHHLIIDDGFLLSSVSHIQEA